MAKKRALTFIPRTLSPRPMTFEQATVIIGSRPDADIVLDDTAEPVHALVRQRNETVELAAFGPLELNGAIVERATLSEGDHIRIGRLSFVFLQNELEEPVQEEPTVVELPNLDGALQGVDRDPEGIPSAVLTREVIEPAKELRTEVALFWGNELLQVAHYAAGATVRVGEGAGNDFVLAAREIKEKSFVLVQPGDGGPRVHVPELAPIELDGHGAQKPRARGALIEEGRLVDERLSLGQNEKLAIALGALTLVVKRVPSTTVVTRPLGERMDQAFVSVLTFTGIAAAFLFGLALTTPKGPDSFEDTLTKSKGTFEVRDLDKPTQSKGKAQKGQLGRIGSRNATKKETAAAKPGGKKIDNRKAALNTGLLLALSGMKTSASAKILGPGGLDRGINDLLKGMRGSAQGEQAGSDGMGPRGNGPGGGGDSLDIGKIGGDGTRGGFDDVDLKGGDRKEREVEVIKKDSKDPVPTEMIARVLGRAASQLRNCYERELGKEPDLHGKVVVVFDISAGGDVGTVSARQGTLQHLAVSECVERVVSRLHFQPLKAPLTVKYPLVFTTTGR